MRLRVPNPAKPRRLIRLNAKPTKAHQSKKAYRRVKRWHDE